MRGSTESLEVSLGALTEPVNHSQTGHTTGVVACLVMPQSYRREHALNWIGRSNVRPVFGRKIIKRQQPLAGVAAEERGAFGERSPRTIRQYIGTKSHCGCCESGYAQEQKERLIARCNVNGHE
jgi:hypothetical protein